MGLDATENRGSSSPTMTSWAGWDASRLYEQGQRWLRGELGSTVASHELFSLFLQAGLAIGICSYIFCPASCGEEPIW